MISIFYGYRTINRTMLKSIMIKRLKHVETNILDVKHDNENNNILLRILKYEEYSNTEYIHIYT